MTDIEMLPDGIVELLNSPELLAVLDEAADEMAQTAITFTRRSSHPTRGYHIADAYYVVPAKPGPQGGEAAFANRSPYHHMLEFGSINNAPEAPSRRAITAAGYQLEAVPR